MTRNEFPQPAPYEPAALRGRRTLFRGEVNRGKTELLSRILGAFLEAGETDLAVLDMAPDLMRGVGGKMRPPRGNAVRYFATMIHPPRLSGRTPDETRILAEGNARRLEILFDRVDERPAAVLLINDVSIYLQAAGPDRLMELVGRSPTVVMNGYWGLSLGGGELGTREHDNMRVLAAACHRVVDL
ncbi:MAG: hypothetical protein JRJ35_13560 [Deltaproteobacteria bacterium]|nr:hypothetical protein [Deltaproteobacteria bacterium]MBW1949688.1 hypothetical protein [Deltaproteobacteria bacterium]MBW2008820.1 hypothetical protein [Deltaproteobacteria bacterium]